MDVRERMQRTLDGYQAGVRVLGVEIEKADPPAQVVDAFRDVQVAEQNADAARNQAQGYAQQVLAQAEGEAEAFDKVYAQYRLAPEVTRQRLYYETMERVLSQTDKTIVETDNVTPYLPLPEIRRRRVAARHHRDRTGGGSNMSNFLQDHRNTVIALAVLVIGFMMSAYVVPEEDQVVIIRTGEPVGTVNTPGGETDAGLYFRVPFIDSVNRIEKRLLDLEMTDEEVLSADQQRLLVNAYARFRITDPVRMVERAGSTDGVRNALEPILNSVLRQELGRRTFQAMLTAERGSALANVRTNLDRQARQYGAEVVDVKIMRTDLPEAPLQSAFRRMDRTANAKGRTIRAGGSMRASSAPRPMPKRTDLCRAFGKDAEFYDFYRAMQSYGATFSNDDNPSESASSCRRTMNICGSSAGGVDGSSNGAGTLFNRHSPAGPTFTRRSREFHSLVSVLPTAGCLHNMALDEKDVKPVRYAYSVTSALLVGGAAISLATGYPAGAQVAQNDDSQMARVVPRAGAPESFADLTAQLQPAVVNISTRQRIEVSNRQGNPDAGTPFEGLFNRRGGQQQEPQYREGQSLGSGFVISADGYVVTNNRVVQPQRARHG